MDRPCMRRRLLCRGRRHRDVPEEQRELVFAESSSGESMRARTAGGKPRLVVNTGARSRHRRSMPEGHAGARPTRAPLRTNPPAETRRYVPTPSRCECSRTPQLGREPPLSHGYASRKLEEIKEGDILAGKYRVERVLGIGGMGVVVAAHHIHLDEKVALKFLRPEALGNPEAVARFAREARAAVKIKSEHVARVIDVGHLENGAP
jgi:hypothetical protein